MNHTHSVQIQGERLGDLIEWDKQMASLVALRAPWSPCGLLGRPAGSLVALRAPCGAICSGILSAVNKQYRDSLFNQGVGQIWVATMGHFSVAISREIIACNNNRLEGAKISWGTSGGKIDFNIYSL